MAPSPAGTASCMKRPRACTRATAVAKSRASAQTSAEYSPRLWPTAMAGSGPPAWRHTRSVATPAASIAGCVCSVALRRSSGPSWQSFQRS